MAAMAATLAAAAAPAPPITSQPPRRIAGVTTASSFPLSRYPSLSSAFLSSPSALQVATPRQCRGFAVACQPSPSQGPTAVSTKLYVSGLSFRTTEESLRNAFQNFGQLVEVNLVMDRMANRPRGFAFLRYASEDECKKAIEGMHGKFLDGRVIFVEVAKSRWELRQASKKPQPPRLF